ncbi:GtrA family protein [Glacieibacterium megasporae]|uniref:GtrA family protein n=1 Tax=Glacieibacterium megasporae TaxID=2835787 RepID=UPI001C1DCF54|nr:GtrA family protein [Polymorphobacter megasporae]UAJ12699.1 GtrA family protein [Polymorphobacter megasporae]
MYTQLTRYAVAGASASAVYSLVYLLFANRLLPPGQAVIAVVPAFLVSLLISFQLHSRWSFAGHGSRDEKVSQPLRFFFVQSAGMLANFFITYLVTKILMQPNWVALVPSLTLTPILTFLLQRRWVFR